MEFSQNVAKRMSSCKNFRHIPDIHTRVQQDNPRIRNHPDNTETRRNVGGDSHRRVRLPPFSRFIESSPFRVHEVFQLMVEAHRIADPGSREGVFPINIH
jgi:hypothetical protein